MIEISQEAKNKILDSFKNNPGKAPLISLQQGGCAGSMLVLTLCDPSNFVGEKICVDSIEFLIESSAIPYIEDIYIFVKNQLGAEILIKNKKNQTCKCGKSFKK